MKSIKKRLVAAKQLFMKNDVCPVGAVMCLETGNFSNDYPNHEEIAEYFVKDELEIWIGIMLLYDNKIKKCRRINHPYKEMVFNIILRHVRNFH